jgi:phosphoheptose isomerase
MQSMIRLLFEESLEARRRSLALVDDVAAAGRVLVDCLNAGRKILVCGNGGSAADAQHFAAELVGRFERERPGRPCLALTTDTSILTAWPNDYAFETVFARQVSTFGQTGDVLVGISTSGNSPNVLAAMDEAARKGMSRIALSGRGGGRLAELAGVHQIIVPSDRTSTIQEVHISVIHAWSALIDEWCR